MSEYGSGVVVCLAKFSEHMHPQLLARWEDLELQNPDLFNFSHSLEMLMNGASDHFYDLDREKAPLVLVELADLTLEIGHGFTGKKWTKQDWERVRHLWQLSCEVLDRQLGVTPDWGEW